ncbi:hypothetical protein DNK06_03330 [Pseudomonas daroniae]|uniref:C4-dicarboxylate ABC transporter n=2 Tax=Pseudomonadales TaxID=72274 RepID=A0A4Q9QSE5_9GAMM|nr:hypothetical protein DNK06_03330 [Pseudomonas daroniae]TBU85109.1 hypothetical protein DNK31_05710 [Pseudomonas sp. FRB 228]TBU93598.1 hypothetical protein DNJ99_04360 [Pseudomonas daroniae]
MKIRLAAQAHAQARSGRIIMHKLFVGAIAATLLALLSPICWAKPFTLRVAHALAPTEPINVELEAFAKAVSERSDGRLRILVFPSEQLGANRGLLEQVRMGAPIIQVADPAFMSDFVPDFGVLNGPYLLDRPQDFQRILDSPWYANLKKRAAVAGFHPLAFNFFFGSRHMLGDKPFRTPADLAGVTMRIAPNPIWAATFGSLRARGVPLPWTEVYSALSQNVVAAVETPLGSMVGARLQEQRKTLSLTRHFDAYLGLVMSEKVFEGMEPDLRNILTEEAEKAGDAMTRRTLVNDQKILKDLEAQGVTVIRDIDIQAFRQTTQSVYETMPGWTPGTYSEIRKILSD